VIQEDPSFSKNSRINIYKNAWKIRLWGSLEEDYEALARSLGSVVFDQILKEYLRKYPSSSYTLANVGDHLPEFLVEWDYPQKKLWHIDLALLERAYYQAYSAADPEVWDLNAMAQAAPEEMEKLQLKTEASVYLIQSGWKIDSVWRGKVSEPLPVKSYYMVYRQGFTIKLKQLSHKAFKLLSIISRTATLGEVIELYPNPATVQLLLNWASLGVVKPIL
jgi:hypothetical protein